MSTVSAVLMLSGLQVCAAVTKCWIIKWPVPDNLRVKKKKASLLNRMVKDRQRILRLKNQS